MIIMGLDISLNGYGIAIGNETTIFHTRVIKPPKNATFNEKLINIQDQLKEVIAIYQPEKVIIEDTYSRLNVKTLKTLEKIHGLSIMILINNHIEYEYITTMEMKKAVIGKTKKGDNLKELTREAVYKHYNIDSLTYDESDAVALILTLFK